MTEALKGNQRPMWLLFPGIGVQRAAAAKGLLRIPVFAAAIERAAAALRPLNCDLVWILTEAPESKFDDVINIMVSIIAVQVALVDVFCAIGLRIEGIIGTSLGELAAAYADDTLNVEQTILAAYWRARCMAEANIPLGAKAFIKLPLEECMKRCPPETDISVKVSQNSVIVTGPIPTVKKFEKTLASEGVFVKLLSQGLRFHTKHVVAAAPALRKHLKEIIPNPKPRSPRWISSCLPQEEWNSEIGKMSSAEYILNMNRIQVDMVTPLQVMPKNAVLVEVSTFAKVLKYLKPNLPMSVTTIELVHKDAPYPATQLLEAIMKIFLATGEQLPIKRLLDVFCCHSSTLKGLEQQ